MVPFFVTPISTLSFVQLHVFLAEPPAMDLFICDQPSNKELLPQSVARDLVPQSVARDTVRCTLHVNRGVKLNQKASEWGPGLSKTSLYLGLEEDFDGGNEWGHCGSC